MDEAAVELRFDGQRYAYWQQVDIRESVDDLCASVHLGYVKPGAGSSLGLTANTVVDVLVGGDVVTKARSDINGELINLYRVVKHHLEELVRQFKWCLISREMFDWLKETPPEPLTDNEITMVHGVSFAMP